MSCHVLRLKKIAAGCRAVFPGSGGLLRAGGEGVGKRYPGHPPACLATRRWVGRRRFQADDAPFVSVVRFGALFCQWLAGFLHCAAALGMRTIEPTPLCFSKGHIIKTTTLLGTEKSSPAPGALHVITKSRKGEPKHNKTRSPRHRWKDPCSSAPSPGWVTSFLCWVQISTFTYVLQTFPVFLKQECPRRKMTHTTVIVLDSKL